MFPFFSVLFCISGLLRKFKISVSLDFSNLRNIDTILFLVGHPPNQLLCLSVRLFDHPSSTNITIKRMCLSPPEKMYHEFKLVCLSHLNIKVKISYMGESAASNLHECDMYHILNKWYYAELSFCKLSRTFFRTLVFIHWDIHIVSNLLYSLHY